MEGERVEEREEEMGAREEEGHTHLGHGGFLRLGCRHEVFQELHKPTFSHLVLGHLNGRRIETVGFESVGQDSLQLYFPGAHCCE